MGGSKSALPADVVPYYKARLIDHENAVVDSRDDDAQAAANQAALAAALAPFRRDQAKPE